MEKHNKSGKFLVYLLLLTVLCIDKIYEKDHVYSTVDNEEKVC